nr:MAG TPA: hypothetical protein [Caudoviricetes sp.]
MRPFFLTSPLKPATCYLYPASTIYPPHFLKFKL